MKVIGKYFLRVFMFLVLISTIIFFYFEQLKSFYLTNSTLNSIILIVIGVGIIYVTRQLIFLVNELNWLNKLLKNNKILN